MVHFFEWMGKKREKDIFGESLLHINKVLEAVKFLDSAIKCFVGKSDQNMLRDLLHKIAQAEHEADNIRKQATFDIASGEILPPDQSELLTFVFKIDALADCAHSAGRCMALWSGEFFEPAKKGLVRMCIIALESTEKLKQALELMEAKYKKKVIGICNEIEALEDTADDEKRELLKIILNSDLPVGKLLTARDLLESIEDICDNAKHCADILQLLIIRL